ncbi:hypothetical protein AVEN_136410-1, partial [Araneus ventricosus]
MGGGYGYSEFEKREDVFLLKRSTFLAGGTLIGRCRIWKNLGDMAENVRCFARNRIGVEKRSFVWNLEDQHFSAGERVHLSDKIDGERYRLDVCESLFGLCLSEYISSQSQEVPSIYSYCYQYSSEVLAFFIGWSCLFSQAAMTAAICKVAAILVNQWTDHALEKLLENSPFTFPDSLPSIAFVLAFIIFILTGINETVAWFVFFIPVSFLLLLTSFAITRAANKEESFLYSDKLIGVRSVDE